MTTGGLEPRPTYGKFANVRRSTSLRLSYRPQLIWLCIESSQGDTDAKASRQSYPSQKQRADVLGDDFHNSSSPQPLDKVLGSRRTCGLFLRLWSPVSKGRKFLLCKDSTDQDSADFSVLFKRATSKSLSFRVALRAVIVLSFSANADLSSAIVVSFALRDASSWPLLWCLRSPFAFFRFLFGLASLIGRDGIAGSHCFPSARSSGRLDENLIGRLSRGRLRSISQ